MSSDEIKKKYAEKIKKLSEELANELLQNEPDLEKKFITLDTDVRDILIGIGNNTMQIVGNAIEKRIKKKPHKKG